MNVASIWLSFCCCRRFRISVFSEILQLCKFHTQFRTLFIFVVAWNSKKKYWTLKNKHVLLKGVVFSLCFL